MAICCYQLYRYRQLSIWSSTKRNANSFEIEALKAQAIAARTYALKNMNKHNNVKDTIFVIRPIVRFMEEWMVNKKRPIELLMKLGHDNCLMEIL